MIKWANSIADLFIALDIPVRGLSLHLRGLAGSLQRASWITNEEEGEQQSKSAKQKLWLPSGTAPFLHLLEPERHYCLNYPAWRGGRSIQHTKTNVSQYPFSCGFDMQAVIFKRRPLCRTLPSLGHSMAQAQNLHWITFSSGVLGKGAFCWNCSYQLQIMAFSCFQI